MLSAPATGPCTVPSVASRGGTPFQLDSKAPSIPLAEFVATEARYATLARTYPHQALAWRAGTSRRDRAVAVLRAAGFCATDRSKVASDVGPEVDSDAEDRDDEEVE